MASSDAGLDPRTLGYLSKALKALKDGQLESAQDFAHAALEENPKAAPAYQLLGNIAHQQGHLNEARRHFEKVLELDDSKAATHRQLGALSARLGKMNEAIKHYRDALERQQDNALLFAELAAIEEASGALDDATSHYQKALELDPEHKKAKAGLARIEDRLFPPPLRTENERLHAQARIALKRGDLKRAETVYRAAIAREPEDVESFIGLGSIELRRNNPIGAIGILAQAVELAPIHTHARNNLAVALLMQNRLDEAEQHLLQLIETDPGYAEAYNNLGIIRLSHDQAELAVNNFRQALSIQEDYHQARHNLGATLMKLGQNAHAAHELKQLLDKGILAPQVLSDFGSAQYRDGNIQAALDSFNRILAEHPNDADAHVRRGQCLMRLGEYTDGWPELQWHWRLPGQAPSYADALPHSHRWDNDKAPSEQRVLIHAERQAGDNIQYLRYLQSLRNDNQHLQIWAPPVMAQLLRDNQLADAVHDSPEPPSLSSYDCHLALGRLPQLAGTELDSIPSYENYLEAKTPLNAAARALLEAHPAQGRQRIGLYWGDAAHTGGDHNDLCPHDALDALLEHDNCQFIALQASDDDRLLQPLAQASSEGSVQNDWAQAAAVIAQCDRVISVNGLYAHLSAALGVPTWVLLAPSSAWVWGNNQTHSDWYPSARLWRREKIEDNPNAWESLIGQLADGLKS